MKNNKLNILIKEIYLINKKQLSFILDLTLQLVLLIAIISTSYVLYSLTQLI